MSDAPSLQIDDWIYTIGEKGGLKHHRPTSTDDPKRIHHTHPPLHHQAQVKKFQEDHAARNNIYIVKRQPLKGKKPIPLKKETPPFTSEETTKADPIAPVKLTAESKNNKAVRRVASKKTPGVVKTNQLEIAADKADAISKLQECSLVKEWIRQYVTSNFEVLQSSVTVYYSRGVIDLPTAQKLLTQRKFNMNGCDFLQVCSESFYESQLDRVNSLLALYCDAAVSFDEGKNMRVIKTFQCGELIEFASVEEWIGILSKIYLCAIEKRCISIVIDISLPEAKVQSQQTLQSALLSVLKTIRSKPSNAAIRTSLVTLVPFKMEEVVEYATFQLAAEKSDLSNTLFVAFADPRYLLSRNMFFDTTSCFVTTCPSFNPFFHNNTVFAEY